MILTSLIRCVSFSVEKTEGKYLSRSFGMSIPLGIRLIRLMGLTCMVIASVSNKLGADPSVQSRTDDHSTPITKTEAVWSEVALICAFLWCVALV